ncbi:MAG: tetratricopeptide repeat protein [Gammaproteobacteria bacterium]|nr:tetratricopeptide repeat protein [Gammaproteobacteria bacterium]
MKKLNKKHQARINTLFQQAQGYFNSGYLQQARSGCTDILQLNPQHAEALHLLGLICHRAGDTQSAVQFIEQAVAANPKSEAYLGNLGTMYSMLGNIQAAARAYERALAIAPHSAAIHMNLGVVYTREGRYDDAIEAYRKAIALKPGFAEAHNNLGMDLERKALLNEAAAQFQLALKHNPQLQNARQNLLFLLSYYCLSTPEQVLEEHRQWDRIYGAHGRQHQFAHSRHGDPHKRLRIGYVSPDFRRHPVSTFIEPLLAKHHRDQVEIFCYAEVFEPDAVTKHLQSLADHWRSTINTPDEQVAHMIHDDQIDILIDLAGHTAFSRLPIFTYKPAPIQATYLGYCATTGLQAMDYWITDNVLHPDNTHDCASETIYRLPRCWVVYQPPAGAPDIQPRAAHAPLTFGSFNNTRKLGDAVISAWCTILNRVPGSRLLLKSRYLDQPHERQLIAEKFRQHGIAPDRLQLQGASPFPDYLNVYNEIDIALDTFPRSGGTTAADALWMGLPVITLAGQRYVERLAASKLSAINRSEWIANTTEEYIEIAVSLANNPQLRAELRQTQRAAMAASPLCDGEGLATAMEEAYRTMWRDYLEQP